MENKNGKNKKEDNKYVLLEKPMFFNSKMNKQENDLSNGGNSNKDNNNISNPSKNKDNEKKVIQNNNKPPKTNTNFNNNNKKESPEKEMKFRCFKSDPNDTKWCSRYGRPDYIKFNRNEEDENYFKEHFKNLEKKEAFDFGSMEKNAEIHIFLKNKEIFDDSNNIIDSFKNIDFHPLIQKNLTKMKYDLMTPIQKAIIPYILKLKDCLGCAETGSGKTIAFLAPIISLLLKDGPPEEDEKFLNPNSKYTNTCSYPVFLVLVPTRELAEQIYVEARKLLYKTGIVVCKCYGGVPTDSQMRELRQGVDIVIGTPGRINEFIDKKVLYLNLIKYLVIDESDRMLDMGFKPQLENIICKNNQMKPKEERINLMFSATIPFEVEEISYQFMKEDCYLITTNKNKENKNGYNANENVEQTIYYVEDEDKILKLHEILQSIEGNVIIFLEKKKSVDKLEGFLLNRNYNAIGIHGDKLQVERQKAIKKFSSGEIPILVATDVASRGLDFPNVSYVFNFDMPKNIEDYIHRIGRTGRVGNKGKAISFYNENNKQIGEALVKELKRANQTIPDFLEEFDYTTRYYKNDDYYYNYAFGDNENDENNNNKEIEDKKYLENKFRETFNKKYDNRDYYKNNRMQYNHRGRGRGNYRGNYFKYRRHNDHNGFYNKGRHNNDNWRK
jgi:superfamily II DNA/RNA helicase